MGRAEDLTGRVFGRLTVIERAENRSGRACWLCKCECGNVKSYYANHLKKGSTKSCGCLAQEMKQSQEFKELHSNMMKELNNKQWQNEEYKNKMSNIAKQRATQLWQNEEYRNRMNEIQQSDEYKFKISRAMLREDIRELHSNTMKEIASHLWENEEYRERQANRMRELSNELWKDEDYRQMHVNMMKDKWQNEEFRQMKIDGNKKMWENEEYRRIMSQNNSNWKGGITPISQYLRNLNEQWYAECKKQANYRCQLTGKQGRLNTHHLKAFNIIVIEAHLINNIEVKEVIGDYKEQELLTLKNHISNWHKDMNNAIVLHEDVHNLFHSLYGRGDNTLEQFEEFKQRYLNGEFGDIVGSN